MRVLVTGAQGHVGEVIAERLAQQGYVTVGVDIRESPSDCEETSVQQDMSNPRAAEELRRRVPRCDAIVHAAACLDTAVESVSLIPSNCVGTQQALLLARAWRPCVFVNISSVQVIGTPQYHPITEEHPASPATAYHASKLFAEHLARICDAKDLPTVSLRITSPVGPNMARDRIVSVFVRNALAGKPLLIQGAGSRQQNYVDERDVARAVEASICRSISGVVNIGALSAISNLELARLCVETLNSRAPIEFTGHDDPEEGLVWDVAIDRALDLIDFRPGFTLRESIEYLAGKLS